MGGGTTEKRRKVLIRIEKKGTAMGRRNVKKRGTAEKDYGT